MNKEEFVNLLKYDNGITICIPAFNAQEYIEECLDSIQNQTYFEFNNNYEIIVGIDGCSRTLSKINEIKHKYKNLRIFYDNKNCGCYVTRNTIYLNATYNNIVTFDADDVMMNNMISEIMKYSKAFDLCRYKCYDFNSKNKINVDFLNNKNKSNIDMKFNPNYYHYGSIFFKKKVFYDLNGFDIKPCGMDSDFLNRVAIANIYKIFYINKPLLCYRHHSEQLTKNKKTGFSSQLRSEVFKYIKQKIKNGIIKNKEIIYNKNMREI